MGAGCSRPVAIDLFAGAGGLSLGFEQAGFDVAVAVEADPIHALTHQFNFPDCDVLQGDVAKVTGKQLLLMVNRSLAKRGSGPVRRIDALIGGPPCQGFSTGGKRDQYDDRNQLFLEFVRLVEELRPRTFCLENVFGLLEPRFDPLREEAFTRLARAGYQFSGTNEVQNCVDFGVPQSRRRFILLGAHRNSAPSRPLGAAGVVTVADAFEGLPTPLNYPDLRHTDEVTLNLGDRDVMNTVTGVYASSLNGLRRSPGDFSFKREWDRNRITNSRLTAHRAETIARFQTTSPGTVENRSRLYRLSLKGVSRTLRAGTGSDRGSHTSPRPIHPIEDRVVTVREAARLHGYPDWFRFHTTNWHGHRQVGNSVPPPLGRAAGQSLLNVLSITPRVPDEIKSLGRPDLLYCSSSEAVRRTVKI